MYCTVEGCQRPTRATGLCNAHYLRKRSGKDPAAPVQGHVSHDASIADRLLVGLPDRPTDGCWLWTRAVDSKGYGKFGYRGRTLAAHRAAYELWVGPASGAVLHSCDEPLCCNPAHLSVGSQAQNMQECAERGRAARKLTPEAVREIRADTRSQQAIADEHGVNQTLISAIKRGRIWTHV